MGLPKTKLENNKVYAFSKSFSRYYCENNHLPESEEKLVSLLQIKVFYLQDVNVQKETK